MSGTPPIGPGSTVRLAEVLSALALASDVGHDQPLEKSLRNAVIAARLGAVLGVAGEELSAIYYVALLRSMGCTGNSHVTAALMGGDDRAFLGLVQALAGGDAHEWARSAAAHVARHAPELAGDRTEAWFLTAGLGVGRAARDSACEVAVTLARRLGLPAAVQTGLDQVYERWDGRGPGRIGGDALCLAARVSHLVDVVEIAHRTGGVPAALDIVARRLGTHFDPAVAVTFAAGAVDLLDGLEEVDALDAALAAEPAPRRYCPRSELIELARAIADFADLKSPWTLGHSPAVAELAARAAPTPADADALRLAGLLHDLGRVAVPNGIWDKPGGLGSAQWERVRVHPYYTERILARTRVFADLATLAGAHHERLDGLGYHRAVADESLTHPMRLLAVADAYVAMTSARPHRAGLSPPVAAAQLDRAAADGRLCPAAVASVLTAAGTRRPEPAALPGGLTEREADVLKLLTRGQTNKQIAAALFVSPRTVQHHVAHIFDKIDRRTRAGAAMFAMEHRML